MSEAKNAIDLIENAPDKVAKTFHFVITCVQGYHKNQRKKI